MNPGSKTKDRKMGQPLFETQREKVIAAYKNANQPYTASTKPYKSVVSFSFTDTNLITAASVSWLITTGSGGTGVPLDWFSYKLGDPVPGNVATYRVANESDTNISKARTTNGAEDFVIEGMSASCRSIRVNFDTVLDITDTNVLAALNAEAPIYDPAALYVPPQIQSPFNLQNGLFRSLAPYVAITFEWDRRRIEKIGTLEQIPEGAANSYLNASGEPSTNDRYRIPEGYIWRREGEPDSEFVVRGTLTDVVCVPILNVAVPQTGTAGTVVEPTSVFLDVVLRLHGLSVKLPSRN
jgi:hypothetical protein